MADQFAYKTGSLWSPSSATPKLSTAVMGEIANSAIASFHSYQMDKIKYQMQADAVAFKRAAEEQRRRQQGWMYARNKEKLQESLASERLAMDIEHMKTAAQVQNAAVAANVSNASSVVRDVQRQQLRAELYQERDHLNQLEKLKIQAYDTQRSDEVLYEPQAPSTVGALGQFGIKAVSIGQEAYKPFVPAKQ